MFNMYSRINHIDVGIIKRHRSRSINRLIDNCHDHFVLRPLNSVLYNNYLLISSSYKKSYMNKMYILYLRPTRPRRYNIYSVLT